MTFADQIIEEPVFGEVTQYQGYQFNYWPDDPELSRVLFLDCSFQELNFTGNIKDCRFVGSSFYNCNFHNVKLSGTRFYGCNLISCSIEGASLGFVEFNGCYVVGLGVYRLGVGDNRGFSPYAVRSVRTGGVIVCNTEFGALTLADAIKAYNADTYFGRRSLAGRWSRELAALHGMEKRGKLDWLANVLIDAAGPEMEDY